MDKKRVLVVDDDPELLQLVRALLVPLNVEVVTTDAADTAAILLRAGPPVDLLVLDLMLPEVSGVELLRQLRADSTYNRLPVLMLSALIEPERIRAALDAGADRYLTKPYIANNLVAVVQDMLRTGRHE